MQEKSGTKLVILLEFEKMTKLGKILRIRLSPDSSTDAKFLMATEGESWP